jgi:hypothetical protein
MSVLSGSDVIRGGDSRVERAAHLAANEVLDESPTVLTAGGCAATW